MPRPTKEQLRPPRKKIRVRAGDGLVVFFPRATLAAPGGRGYVLYGDEVVEVYADDRFVIRSLRNGDLVEVKDEPKVIKRDTPRGRRTGTVTGAEFATIDDDTSKER